MKNHHYLICILLIALVSNCSKCPDPKSGNTFNVNQDDLPYIIPYSDTSKVRFLKNGTDTVIFVSQGLKNTYIEQNQADGNCSSTNRIQQFSLMMKSKNNDFFEMQILNDKIDYITFNINNLLFEKMFGQQFYATGDLKRTFIDSISINNSLFDSVQQINFGNNYFIVKPRYGILKIKSTNLFEIIN